MNNLGRIRAPKPRDYLNFQEHSVARSFVAGSHSRARKVTNMFTRLSPQVRRFTRLSVSLFRRAARATKGTQFRGLPKGGRADGARASGTGEGEDE